MPIISRTTNRVLPPNARTADVARETLHRAIPIQNRKTDAAFQVNGYDGVLYSYLTSGLPCACKAKGKAINTRLDENGKAPLSVINQMLTASDSFGVKAYASQRTNTPHYAEQKAQRTNSILEVNLTGIQEAPVRLSSLFDDEDLDGANRFTEGLPDRIDIDGSNPNASLIIERDMSTDVHSMESDFDTSLMGHSDCSCPVCFGSGYVGGYSIMHGYRYVFNFQHPTTNLPATANIAIEKEVPTITTDRITWTIVLPVGGVGVDALRLWNDSTQVFGYKILIDNTPLFSENDLFKFCDGRTHLLSLQFNQDTEFTHFEIQVNQSNFSANFELPKLSKGSTQSLREATDPFSVFLSPLIPTVKVLDVIVESTYGKALQVKTVTGLNDRRLTTMGFEVEVRPTQPQELFSLLPRRRPLESTNTRRMVIANPNAT